MFSKSIKLKKIILKEYYLQKTLYNNDMYTT